MALKKIEALLKIENLLVMEGISREQLIMHWLKSGDVDFNVIKNKFQGLQSSSVIEPANVKPGMFYYADGKISDEYTNDGVIAIIISVNQHEGTAIALSLASEILPFSSDHLCIDTTGLDGVDATELICAEATKRGLKAEAAQYCQNFSCPGVKKGSAFLISEREAFDIVSYMYNIRSACFAAGMYVQYILTSTYSSANNEAKVCLLGGASMGKENIDCEFPVHAAFKINLRKNVSM